MLPKQYTFAISNNSGGAITEVTIDLEPWKFGSDGALVYGTPQNYLTGSIADANVGGPATPMDNSVDLFLGAHVRFEFTGGGSGDVQVVFLPILTAGTASVYTDILLSINNVTSRSWVVEI